MSSEQGSAVYPLHNGKAPPDEEGNRMGPRAMRVPVVIPGGTIAKEINLLDEIAENEIDCIQTIYVDNLDGSNPVTIRSSLTGQRLTVGIGKQAYLPLLLGIGDGLLTFQRTDAGTLQVYFLNVPVPAVVW